MMGHHPLRTLQPYTNIWHHQEQPYQVPHQATINTGGAAASVCATSQPTPPTGCDGYSLTDQQQGHLLAFITSCRTASPVGLELLEADHRTPSAHSHPFTTTQRCCMA